MPLKGSMDLHRRTRRPSGYSWVSLARVGESALALHGEGYERPKPVDLEIKHGDHQLLAGPLLATGVTRGRRHRTKPRPDIDSTITCAASFSGITRITRRSLSAHFSRRLGEPAGGRRYGDVGCRRIQTADSLRKTRLN